MAELPQSEEKKPGLFAAKPKVAPALDVKPLRDEINSLSTRIKLVEERHSESRNRFHLVEQNVIAHHKREIQDVKNITIEITEVKRQLREVENRIITMIKEIQLTAKKEDVDVLRKYLDLWNPMEFVRLKQVEKIIDEKILQAQEKGLKESENVVSVKER